jgi:hypothetical protein
MLKALHAGLIAATAFSEAAYGQAVRTKADVTCKPASQVLLYDCTIKLMNARTSEPLNGVSLTVGADMPSMPMMHNVRPAKAEPGQQAGSYQARLHLEMHGDWALQLNLSGPVRDRIVTVLRFDPDHVAPAEMPKVPRRKH